MDLKVIAHIYTDFDEKFGIPRQSGLAPSLKGRIVFEKPYRDPNCVRDLDGYDYIWLLWHFSQVPEDKGYSPMVRPPRLGGNRRVGVFASRSPFRPNPIGLSCVKLEKVEPDTPKGPVLYVSGIDMLNGTPIFDIKPYQPGSEAHPLARGGFAQGYAGYRLKVECPEKILAVLPEEMHSGLLETLALDPRPGYQHDEMRTYGILYAGYNVTFQVGRDNLVVTGIEKAVR